MKTAIALCLFAVLAAGLAAFIERNVVCGPGWCVWHGANVAWRK